MISKHHLALLEIVGQEKDDKVRDILLYTFCKDKKFVKALRLLCKNTIKGKLKLTTIQRKKLAKYLSDIRFFSIKKNTNKKQIVQHGSGFLSVLVPIAAAILGPLLNGVFSKNDDGSVSGNQQNSKG